MDPYRQLAAIMFTDIVGYTAIMGDDEKKALELLDRNRSIQKPLIEKYGGNCIKELGDGILATFANATDAVSSAIVIQQSCAAVPGLKLRIGIHLSEVMFEDNDVFGDGVNIASRIQAIASIGCVWISDVVQKNIFNKKEIATKFIGEEKLKNVKDPIAIYEVNISSAHSMQLTPVLTAWGNGPTTSKKSIALLPFTNLSNDPGQEYFSDGITEEILNSLTHLKDLKVISRSSSFQFKGKDLTLKEIGKRLNVANILQGSLRKQGNRIRISAQLVNVNDGTQLWGDRYDREIEDIFAIQDEIALAITERMKVALLGGEKELIKKAVVTDTEAYELYLKGRYYWNKRGRGLLNSLQLFEEALKIDPTLAKAYAGLADAYSALGLYGIIAPSDAIPKAKQAALKSIEIDPSACEPYTSMGFIYGIYENDRYLANKNFATALEINPNYAAGHSWYSFYLTIVENNLARAEQEGLQSTVLEQHNAVAYYITGLAFIAQRKFNESLTEALKSIEIDAALFLPYFLAGWCYIELNELVKAIEYLEMSLNLSTRHSWPLGFMAYAQVKNGNPQRAKDLVNEIVERDRTSYFSVFGSAIGAAAIDDIDLTLKFLEKGYSNKDILMPIFAHLSVMPENLRNNTRFLNFLRKIKLIN